jgi:predicted nucleotide-binding protein (sugar kinase/HSP70/actin superfamily)
MRVGIPRALLYYKYFPMWQKFCQELGIETVVSDPTTQQMLSAGSSRVTADTCLPVKVFLGHVLSLVDKCDCIFVPAVRSVEKKVYNCSKFLGLPDITKAVIPELPPMIDADIDINKGMGNLYQEIYKLGLNFSKSKVRVKQAALSAWQTYMEYRNLMSSVKIAPPAAIGKISDSRIESSDNHTEQAPLTTIALVGHPYLINDEYVNHRLVQRLERAGNRILTPEMVTTSQLTSSIASLAGGAYWTYEAEVVGAGGYYLQNEADGIIGVMAFGCGPDSLMMETVRRQASKLKQTPFMCLTLEEHTAEAGVVTRLEAFTDMLRRKKKKMMEICL